MWIQIEDELPPENKYVLIRHNKTNLFDSDDQDGVQFCVAAMRKGISIAERKQLGPTSIRARTYCGADEDGNNRKPYNFTMFGPGSFFGQEVTHWMPIHPPAELCA